MKKKLLFFAFLAIALAFVLCSCGDNTKKPPTGTDDKSEWKTITTPSTADIFSDLLGGGTSVISELSKTNINSKNPKVSLNSKVKVALNDNDFWAALKLNYDNNEKQNAMLAFEVTGKEDSYEDLLVGFYLYQQRIYVAIGQSKFSVNCDYEVWENYFPFNFKNSAGLSATALLISSFVVQEKDALAQERYLDGRKYTNYKLYLNLSASLAKFVKSLDSADGIIDKAKLEKYDELIKNFIGVGIKEIGEGKFPKSSLILDFTLAETKVSELKLFIDIKEINNGGNLFDGENLKIDLDLKTLKLAKTNTSIPFVTNDYMAERSKYVYYKDNAFRATFDVDKENSSEDYQIDFTAKVFQDKTSDNYLFMEYTNKSTNKVDRALYVYEDIVYFYEIIDGEEVCTLSMPTDLTELANRTVNNDFGGTATLDWADLLSYAIGAFNIKSDRLTFDYSRDAFRRLWYNFDDMIAFVDGHFDENILEVEEIKSFFDFLYTPSVISARYDKKFLDVVPETDERLKLTVQKIESAEPLKTLSPKEEELPKE